MFEVIVLSVWLTTAIILFVCAKNVIDGNAANISYNSKAVWITSAVIGLFWPLIVIISIVIWIIKRLKTRKIIKEIDNKISSVFDL
jgi:cell division protein FtsL